MAAAPSWLDQLAAFNRAHTTATSDGGAAAASRTEEDDEREIAAQVEQLLAADPAAASRRRPRAGAADWGAGEPMRRIPTFWVKKDTARSSLQAKLSRRAMAIFIERQSEELLAPEALRALLDWPMHRVNYDQFCDMGRKLGPQCAAEYFRAATFLHFERDRGGRISVAAFVGFVVRREELLRCRLHLSCYSSDLSGFITMVDLTHYVTGVVQSLPQLDHIDGFDEMFLPFYTLTAVSKFFFFLDPMHRGKVRIRELACSAELSELEELRQYQYSSDAPFVAPWEGGNWFSPHFAMQFYRYYLMLDADRNGLLSKEELRQFGRPPPAQSSQSAQGSQQEDIGDNEDDSGGGGSLVLPVPPCALTNVFIDRVFEECRLYDGEMDYKTFVDFTLAMTYKHRPESLAYCFKLLDVRNRGELTAFEIQFFFREVVAGIRDLVSDATTADSATVSAAASQEDAAAAAATAAADSAAQLAEFSGNVNVEDVRDEILDMVNPVKAGCITLDDLIRCGVGGTVVAMLIDLQGFYDYDNREVLIFSSPPGGQTRPAQ